MTLIEVCCGDLESVAAAAEADAKRIELCRDLPLDGLTPDPDELRRIRQAYPSLTVHVLIRPRSGNFVYSPAEIDQHLEAARAALAAGADGLVLGALTPDGQVDRKALERMLPSLRGVSLTFHRAFDRVTDPFRSLEEIIDLGFDRILTSGGAATALAGAPRLRALREAARGRIGILPGGGITPDNIREVVLRSGAEEVHGSFCLGGAHSSAEAIRSAQEALRSL